MRRYSMLSGQVHGKVDWITANGKEAGLFLRTSQRDATRCVIRGPEIEQLIANNVLQKGMMLTAHGEISARTFRRAGGEVVPEILCSVSRVLAESQLEHRMRGSLHVTLKGVVMHWDPSRTQIKTFLNKGELGRTEQITCNVYLGNWFQGLTPESRSNLTQSICKGREFTLAALAEVTYYETAAAGITPVISMLPLDFKMQG